MPTVDFTLEDIKKVIDEGLDERFIAEREHTAQMLQLERQHTGQLLRAERQHTEQMFQVERGHTRHMIQESTNQVLEQFQSFIDENFNPAMQAVDDHFDHIEDRLDRLEGDSAIVRTDLRHIKQVLRTRTASSASDRA
ncbi:MAG: hypothetical protein JWN01_457 [Patescibacteria group bacterium]|jgi:frataxin-like iron-binding protein CyaY|nr:hypothetical protein [Patescibacteria group bacterium]